MMNNQKGVALIQVLLISAIISILGIHFSYTARNQVEMAMLLEQRVKATQLLSSTQNKVIFSLLTQNSFDQPTEIFPNTQPWNFYGKVFRLDPHTLISIQDNTGLLSQRYIVDQLWEGLLKKIGFTEYQIKLKQSQIKDWQGIDNGFSLTSIIQPKTLENGVIYPNRAIQLKHEITELFLENEIGNVDLSKLTTPLPLISFNPMQAPDTLINALFSEEFATQINSLRIQGLLTTDIMNEILINTNYEPEEGFIRLYNSNSFKVTIQVTQQEVTLQETLEIQLQPKQNIPFLILTRY